MTDESGSANSHRRSKVGRVIADRNLDGLGEELERYWTGEGDEQRSLRELADYFNRRLLESRLAQSGVQSLEGEVENTYRLLTDDDVSAGARTDAETALEHSGIDVDQLRREFVSHQAIHTYLTEYRDVEYAENRNRDRIATTVQSLRRLINRLTAVAETNLHSLDDADWITVGDVDVMVDVQVLCADCGTQYDVVDLLQAGGCDCQ